MCLRRLLILKQQRLHGTHWSDVTVVMHHKVKLQSLRKQYENLNMKDNEKVSEYISRVILITNEMKACGETLSKQVIIEKILRSLTSQFDYIVVEIEHSKDLSTMKVEELQSSLEAHELHMTARTSERKVEQQALKVTLVRSIRSRLGQKPGRKLMMVKGQKLQTLIGRRMSRRERRSLTRIMFSVTVVRTLVTMPEIAGPTKKGSQ